MKTLIIALILCSSNFYGQNKIYPYNKAESEFDKLIELAVKTDSLIKASDELNNGKEYIVKALSEGSIELADSLMVRIGSGGFSKYTYTNEKTNEIIKAEYNKTIHYKYNSKDSINANTERLEISIYYENEKPYFAKFKEFHYDNKSTISTHKYFIGLNSKRDKIYYSNSFQEKITRYVLELSEDIISKK